MPAPAGDWGRRLGPADLEEDDDTQSACLPCQVWSHPFLSSPQQPRQGNGRVSLPRQDEVYTFTLPLLHLTEPLAEVGAGVGL